MGMVPPPHQIEGDIVPLIRHQPGCFDRTAGPEECPVVKTLENRIFQIAEAVTEVSAWLRVSAEFA